MLSTSASKDPPAETSTLLHNNGRWRVHAAVLAQTQVRSAETSAGRLCTTRCPVPFEHDKLPPGFNWSRSAACSHPRRLLQQGPLSAHLSRCLPPVALLLACPALLRVPSLHSQRRSLSLGLHRMCGSGAIAPQYSMTGVSRIGARRTKLWYASLIASTCASSCEHGRRVAASKGTHLRIWGTLRLEATVYSSSAASASCPLYAGSTRWR